MAKKLEVSKEDALQIALEAIKKKHGKEAICVGQESVQGVEFYTTGVQSIDEALGGGIAKGRIVEIYGPESSSKTTLCLHIVAEAQQIGLTCAYIDMEHALDPLYCAALGVDLDSLIVAQPSTGEEAFQIVEALTKSGAVAIIIIDSVASLVPSAESEGEIGQNHMGRQARLMGQGMRMTTGPAYDTGTSLIYINQLRQKLGCVGPETMVEWR